MLLIIIYKLHIIKFNLHELFMNIVKNMIVPRRIFSNFLILILLGTLVFSTGCNQLKDRPELDKNRPLSAEDKRKRNVAEGRGASLGGIIGGMRGTNYEFSTSNPMWRASLETLDFLPLTTVDYSGGVIISDWYSEPSNNKESLKITIRFLSNEIRSDSIKIIVHKKTCSVDSICDVSLLANSIIKDELRSTILREASLLEKSKKKKK